MHIGIAGPISLKPLARWLRGAPAFPSVYSFTLIGQLADALLERGHAVTVFAGSQEVSEVLRYEEGPLKLIICPRRRSRNAYDFYRLERSFLQEEMEVSACDLIHAHWTYEFAQAALDSRKPVLVTAHDAPLAIQRYFILTKGGAFWLMRMLLAARVLRRTKNLTAVSPYVASHIRQWFRPGRTIEVIPNGVPEEIFEKGKTRLACTGADGESPITIACVLEGFSERKNAKTAMRAFQRFRMKRPDACLRFYGTDFGPGEVAERWAKANGLEAGVEFCGYTPHAKLLNELCEEATLLMHPSLEEAHPMAICEAMAAGVPIIAGKRSGGVPFTLDEGRVGLLTDVSDPQQICDALAAAARDLPALRKTGEAAWHFAYKHFRLGGMVDAYEAEYRRLSTGQVSNAVENSSRP